MRSSVFILILVALQGCAQLHNQSPIEEFGGQIDASDKQRLLAMYGSDSYDYQRVALTSNVECKTLGNFYQTLSLTDTKKAKFIGVARAIYTTMMIDADWLSKLWSSAIKERRDFNKCISIRSAECDLFNTKKSLSQTMTRLKSMVKTSDDKRIFQILSDLQSKVSNTEGSLIAFNQSLSSLKSEFTRADSVYGLN